MFPVHKFSFKLKEQFSAYKKMYAMDNGFIRALSLSFSENRGRLLENAVAIELKRRCVRENAQLFYWDDYHHECDFIVKKGTKIKEVYQVCAELNITNKTREVSGLAAAAREFAVKKAYILTYSQRETIKQKSLTIEVTPAWKWMLETSGVRSQQLKY
jgi:hypothetical protein